MKNINILTSEQLLHFHFSLHILFLKVLGRETGLEGKEGRETVCKGRLRKCIKMTHLERICLNSGDLQSFVLLHGNLGTQIKHVIGITWGRWALSQKIREGAVWGGGWCWKTLEGGGFGAHHGLPLATAGDFTSLLEEQIGTYSFGVF